MADIAQQDIGGGKWLKPNAAKSYQRMRDAGMPSGGIASAGRTYAEQAELYRRWKNGTGNLAARPGTSLHESGLALDVTRGTDAQLWMTAGGEAWQVKTGEKLRCHAWGWYRTVPSEAWHFQYFPDRDQRKNQPQPEEDDMPEPKDLWNWDGIPAPDDIAATGNKEIKPSSYLVLIYKHALAARRAAGEARALARKMAAKLLTAEEVQAAVREALDDKIEDATVVLTVEGDKK